MPAEITESDDVDKIKKYRYCIGCHIDKIRSLLWEAIEDNGWREAIIKNEWQIDDYGDSQVEAHSVEKEE